MNKEYLYYITKDNLHIFKDYLNQIIEEAINYGGDSGGPYFVNQEKLLLKIKQFLKLTGLNEYLVIYNDVYPLLLEKEKVLEKIE